MTVTDTTPPLEPLSDTSWRPTVDAKPGEVTPAGTPTREATRATDSSSLERSAEEELNQATTQLREAERELAAARQTIDALERREKIGDRLREAGAVDLDVARLLTEVAIADMDEPDIKLAVDDLRRHKPYLFASQSGALSNRSMGLRFDPPNSADDAAARAGQSGDRRDLMDYLRLRRRA